MIIFDVKLYILYNKHVFTHQRESSLPMSTLRLRIVIAGFISVLFILLIGVVISAQTTTIMQLIVQIAFCVIFCVPLALSSYAIAEMLVRIAAYRRIRKIVSDMSGGDTILELGNLQGESIRIVCYEDADRIDMATVNPTRAEHNGQPAEFIREYWCFDLREREVTIDLEFDDEEMSPHQVKRLAHTMLRRITSDIRGGWLHPVQ